MASSHEFPSGEMPQPVERHGTRARREGIGGPVLNENTRIALSVTAALAVLAFVLAVGIKYGEWNAERVRVADDVLDARTRVKALEDRFATFDRRLDKFENNQDEQTQSLKEMRPILNTLLYGAGVNAGGGKKPPAEN